jgi:hypothetical protein
VIEASPLQRIVQLTGAIRGQDHQRRRFGLDCAHLGNRDLEVGENLEQERLELVVGPVNLVDEQDRPVTGTDSLQQWPLEQELRAEQLVDRPVVVELARGQGSDLEHLACVVPLVQCLVGVDALVALQSDQSAPKDRREHLRDLGLANTDLAFDQDRAIKRQSDKECGREPTVSQIATVTQDLGQLGYGLRTVHPASPHPA